MNFPPVSRPYFSKNLQRERFWRIFLISVTLIAGAWLALAWPQTRSLDLVVGLQGRLSAPLELLFRAFTFLGDDQFFMIFFSFLIWCVNKNLGYWGVFVLLSSAAYSNLVKDLTLLERPTIPGVTHPSGSYAFPSGHTLTAVTVWSYLAVRIRKKWMWAWVFIAVIMIGFSRIALGYHYLGDVLGGLALGIPFILLFLWVSALFYEKGWVDRYSTPVLLVISVALPATLTFILPGADPPKVLGFLSGASFGYILETTRLRTSPRAPLGLQAVKLLLGLAVLFGIVFGLSGLLPSSVPALGFTRYFLGGIWATLAAPALFVKLRLSKREGAV